MVPVGRGRRLHVIDARPPQARAGVRVVAVASAGTVALDWAGVLSALAALSDEDGRAGRVHALAYDRAGLGWSPAAPGWLRPRTPQELARELVELVEALDREDGELPVVLVGHSLGGLIARAAAGLRPVAGLVLLEPTHAQRLYRPGTREPDRWVRAAIRTRMAGAVGVRRLQAITGGLPVHEAPAAWLPPDLQAATAWRLCGPTHQAAGLRELAGLVTGGQSVRALPLGDLPLRVFAAEPQTRAELEGAELDRQLLALSTDSALIPLPKAVGTRPHYNPHGAKLLAQRLDRLAGLILDAAGTSDPKDTAGPA
ncbi:alpha/beta fold hydrolase [Actinosynnema pretiosum subsp. pretiosum]